MHKIYGAGEKWSGILFIQQICGLELDTSEESLALLYLAALQAICVSSSASNLLIYKYLIDLINDFKYGTRHIISSLREQSADVSCLLLCGGLVKSDLFISTMADAVGIPIVIPDEEESVLLGSAVLGACASQFFPSIEHAMHSMGGSGRSILPNIHEQE